jgi:hypothetical protein
MMYTGLVEDEIDASTVFKQAASNLKSVTNLNDSLDRFGYHSDDRIERRELVSMYTSIKKEMESEIYHLAHSNEYDSAKEMRGRLNSLRREFDGLQTNGAKLIRDDQNRDFERASSQHITDVKQRHQVEEREVERQCQRMREQLAKTHEIEFENLEKIISRSKLPPMVYSKRLIELFKAESG